MLYQIKDGTVSAGGQTILSHVDFYIKEKEKIAVVGKNGAGKTTLLRLLAGELTPDRDDSRGSYGRSNDTVTGAVTAGSDLDGTAKRAQRAKKKKPSGNPETGIAMSRNITIDMLRQTDKSNQDLTIEQILLESCPDKDTFSKRGLTTRWSTTGFLQALASKRVTRRGFLGAFQEENRRRFP